MGKSYLLTHQLCSDYISWHFITKLHESVQTRENHSNRVANHIIYKMSLSSGPIKVEDFKA